MAQFYAPTTYNVELWSSAGGLLADISPITQERQYTLSRNAAEQFTFQLDLTAFESYCTGINADPSTLIAPYQTDVKLKRNGNYLFVAQVTGLEFDFETNDSGINPETGSYNKPTSLTETITVTATGYLNILTDRYYTGSYTNEDSCSIAVDLVNQAQLLTNGNLGITFAPSQYTTGYLYSPTYTQQNVLTELGNLTQLPGALFDLWLDADKVLHTSALQGSRRNDLAFTYGGPGSNVIGLYHQRLGAGALYNEIIGDGSGFGSDGLSSVQDDTVSQENYFLRQNPVSFNNVTDQAQLDADTAAELALSSNPLEIPQIITTGKELENVPFIGPGDRIPLYFPTHPFLSKINGLYQRVEQMVVSIDDNDFDYEIRLTMDSYGFVQGA